MTSIATGFWAGWVAVLTIVSVAGLAWLIVSVYFSGDDSAEVAHVVWDETLREGTTAAPLWWFWMILALLAAFGRLSDPLSRLRLVSRACSAGRKAARSPRASRGTKSASDPMRTAIAARALPELQQDETAMRSASHLFNNHCSACHGPDARGQASLFPDLRDESWQWGRDEAQLAQTITQGRQAVMPPWQAVLNDDGVAKMADYVIALGSGTASPANEMATTYQSYCGACHGADGAGMALLGAPALNDSAWLYGGSTEAVRDSIARGRTGVMPPFGQRLDAAQIKLLTAWLARGAAPLPAQ